MASKIRILLLIFIIFFASKSFAQDTSLYNNFSKKTLWRAAGNNLKDIRQVKYKGRKAVLFNFNKKDWSNDVVGHRIELNGKGNNPPGQFTLNKLYKVSFFILIGSIENTSNRVLIWQFHGNKDSDKIGAGYGNSPTLNCQIINDSFHVFIRTNSLQKIEIGKAAITKNKWLKFRIKTKFAYDSGYAKVSINRNKIAEYKGSNIYHSVGQNSGIGTQLAFGIYSPDAAIYAKIYFSKLKLINL